MLSAILTFGSQTDSVQVAPAHEGVELGIGDAILIKGMAIATGRSEGQLKQQYTEEGDIGIVARKNKGKQATLIKPAPLTIRVRPPQAPPVLYALLLGSKVQ
jgi:hypothetical protein